MADDELHLVFRALDDAGRRALLDELFVDDGQTLTQLCAVLPGMTRYGVMNHLRVLGDAGLITSTKVGRQRHHYLNPIPLRRVHDRWIAKFAEPVVASLSDIVTHFQPDNTRTGDLVMDDTQTPDHRYQAFVAATPDDVWRAMTDGEMTVRYFFNTIVDSTWQPGSPVRYHSPDGDLVADGEIIAADVPHRLEMTFHGHWDPALDAEGPVRTVWLVGEHMGATTVTVEYYDLGPVAREQFVEGIPFIVSGLKSLLETGKPLVG